jgi:hypothetical protein
MYRRFLYDLSRFYFMNVLNRELLGISLHGYSPPLFSAQFDKLSASPATAPTNRNRRREKKVPARLYLCTVFKQIFPSPASLSPISQNCLLPVAEG